jgi:hypothetical protein
MPDPQDYAISQERYRHDEALASFGEYAMFVLMWQIEDFENGLITHCSTCYIPFGKIAEVYGQPAREKCDNCFGTTFEGGYKAKIVRPSLWDANEELEKENIRGEVILGVATVQSVSDFRLRSGDFIFRSDGSRWVMQSIATNHLRTGFDTPSRVDTPVGYNFGQVVRADRNSVAFIIPPDETTLLTLDQPGERYPVDFSDLEEIRGSLT